MPPGLDAPKTESSALAQPETTTLGKRFGARAKEHPGLSGFRLLADGAESFAVRMQIAEKAEKTLDVQYFVLQQDETGQLLLGALLAAADRGVRVRILLDDALGIDGDAKIRPLSAHPNIEIRVFNPLCRAAGAHVPARSRVPAPGGAARLPDAQQALRRRQRRRGDRRTQRRRRVLPGEHRARVRGFRSRGRGADGAATCRARSTFSGTIASPFRSRPSRSAIRPRPISRRLARRLPSTGRRARPRRT